MYKKHALLSAIILLISFSSYAPAQQNVSAVNMNMSAAAQTMYAPYQNLSEVQLWSFISSSFDDGFYPAVLTAAPYFRAKFPTGKYAGESVIVEAETLYRLGRRQESEQLMTAAPDKSAKYLRLAVIAFEDQKYEKAARNAWKGLSLYKDQNPSEQRARLMLYAGRALYKTGDTRQTASVLFSLFHSADAAFLSAEEYLSAAAVYLNAAVSLKKHADAVKIYRASSSLDQFKKLMPQMRDSIRLNGADALLASGETDEALALYEQLMKTAETKTAVAALERSYNFYPDAQKPLLMEKVSALLSSYPEVLAEFWTRAGAAAFSAGKKEEALAAFLRAASYGNAEYIRIGAVYRASLMSSIKADHRGAVELLEKYLDPVSPLYAVYLDHLAEYSAYAGLWNDSRRYAGLLSVHKGITAGMKNRAAFWQSFAAYSSGEYGYAARSASEAEGAYAELLRAKALFNSGSVDESLTLFSALYNDISVPSDIRSDVQLDAVRAFARAGRFAQAWTNLIEIFPTLSSLKSTDSEKVDSGVMYLAGLCAAGMGKWEQAEFLLRTAEGSAARYYHAYSLYRQGKYEAAYDAFTSYQLSASNIEFAWNSLLYAARSAVQTFYITRKSSPWLVRSVINAEKAFNTAVSEQQKIDGVLLVSGVYSDAERYDDALAVLLPHINQTTPFGMTCLFQYASVSSRRKDFEKADESYRTLAERFPLSPLAEESMYRRGEIFYENGIWQRAVENLSAYRRQYPGGKFLEPSLFYISDSHFRQNNDAQSILIGRELLVKYPNSPYLYQTLKNLTALYKKRGEYDAAYKTAGEMTAKFPDQSSRDGIEGQISELLLLAGGADKKTAALLSSFEQAGGLKTPAGRRAGIELIQLYLSSSSKKTEGEDLASSLLKNIPDGEENDTAAQVLFLLGNTEREKLSCTKAAEYFLQSAALSAFTDSDKAAHALYCAVESFDCAQMYSDAQKTYSVLKEKYAGSVWTVRSAALVKQGEKR